MKRKVGFLMRNNTAFTLVEMFMALLVVSIIISASLPVITGRMKAQSGNMNRYQAFPIGGIIVWGVDGALPDNTWLECNGQAIPNGIEYEDARMVFKSNLLPDYRGVFLRGHGGNSSAIGARQGDGIKNISLSKSSKTFSYGGQKVTLDGMSFGLHAPENAAMASTKYGYKVDSAFGIEKYYWGIGNLFAWWSDSGGTFTLPALGPYTFLTDVSLTNSNNITNEVRPMNVAVRYIAKVRR